MNDTPQGTDELGRLVKQDPRRASTWRGDSAIHTQAVIDAAIAAGERTQDQEGEYTGLTHDRIVELLGELAEYRRGDPMRQTLMDTLDRMERERNAMRANVRRLHAWMFNNLNLDLVSEDSTTDQAIKVMSNFKEAMEAAWPHLQTLLTGTVDVLTQAGFIPTKRPTTGDIYPVDWVPQRPQ
jgi:hypothetical protein